MKTLTILIGIFLLAACREDEPSEGIPTDYTEFFNIVDASTGEDWFLSHPSYNPEDVKLIVRNFSDELIETGLDHREYEGKVVFGSAPLKFGITQDDYSTTFILQLNQEDADTIVTKAQIRECGYQCEDRVENIKFYYNEALADEYNFVDNNEFIIRLGKHNASHLADAGELPNENTYIITFEKVVKE